MSLSKHTAASLVLRKVWESDQEAAEALARNIAEGVAYGASKLELNILHKRLRDAILQAQATKMVMEASYGHMDASRIVTPASFEEPAGQ